MAVPLEVEAAGHEQLREEVELGLLLEGLFQMYGSDFRWHARRDVKCRIRNFIRQHKMESVLDLLGRVLRDRRCALALCIALLESETKFLEQAAEIRMLNEAMHHTLSSYPAPRIWIAECTAAEEVLVFAILLAEAGLLERSSIYVTCSNEDILHSLQTASFPANKLPQLEAALRQCGFENRVQEYIHMQGDNAIFSKALRSRIVWSHYNLGTDRSFNEFQLISCRNSLFRFEKAMRRRVIGLFSESLASYGVMHFGEVANDEDYRFLQSFNLEDRNRMLWKRV